MAPAKRKADAGADNTTPPAKKGRRSSETGNEKIDLIDWTQVELRATQHAEGKCHSFNRSDS